MAPTRGECFTFGISNKAREKKVFQERKSDMRTVTGFKEDNDALESCLEDNMKNRKSYVDMNIALRC